MEQTLREFYKAVQVGKDSDPSWKKQIYKVISRLDDYVPDYFKTQTFLEQLEWCPPALVALPQGGALGVSSTRGGATHARATRTRQGHQRSKNRIMWEQEELDEDEFQDF